MRYDVFKGDISAAEVPMIYQPQESLSESSFFRGTESWLLFKGTSAKEYRDLDTTQTAYGIFWPKVDQSSKYQSTCLWRWCFCSCSCNATRDLMIIGYHWFSSWGVLAILEDFLTGKTIWLTKTPKTQSSVSLSVFSYIHASMPQDFLGQHGSTRHCATVISPFSLTFPRFDSHRTNPRIVNLLLALAPEQVLLETPESESSRDKETQTSTYLIVSYHISSYLVISSYLCILRLALSLRLAT